MLKYLLEPQQRSKDEGSGERFEGVREPMLAGGLAW